MSTAYTRISDTETPSISLNPSHTVNRIDPRIYGGFVEHMGRCIYGGLYDPKSEHADENGFRKDVIEAIKELNPPVVRYPGGNFTATYHWTDGIGPKDQRPKRPELAWLGIETNQFGTDEFMKWCKLVGTEPYLCLNMGTGTLDEALAWLEYCNSSQDTYWANKRRENGHEEPYNVKYWALGNEVWGKWQVAQTTREAYAHQAYQWAKALKLLDPSIQLVLCGEIGYSSWDAYVLKECVKWGGHDLGGATTGTFIDMHSIHSYTASMEHVPNVLAPRSAERAIQVAAALIDLARIENAVPSDTPAPLIAFDEWNVWLPSRAPGDKGAEEIFTLSDALAVSAWLAAFVRQSRYLAMANIAQLVNVLGPLRTDPTSGKLVRQAIFYPLHLFSRYMRGQALAVHVRCEFWEGETEPAWVGKMCGTGVLDVAAALDDERWVCLAVVNIDERRDVEAVMEVDGAGIEGKEVWTYTMRGKHIWARNTEQEYDVWVHERLWDGRRTYRFPKASLTMLRWKSWT